MGELTAAWATLGAGVVLLVLLILLVRAPLRRFGRARAAAAADVRRRAESLRTLVNPRRHSAE